MVNHAITGADIITHSVKSLVTDCRKAFGYSMIRNTRIVKKVTNRTMLKTNMIVESTPSPRNCASQISEYRERRGSRATSYEPGRVIDA